MVGVGRQRLECLVGGSRTDICRDGERRAMLTRHDETFRRSYGRGDHSKPQALGPLDDGCRVQHCRLALRSGIASVI
jgi:hypothetical protein